MKYRKRPIVIEATRWFKNGDHPDDKSEMVYPDPNSTTQFEPFLSEGKIVRRFNHSVVNGSEICPICRKIFYIHGWIDTLEGGHRVCPGDWIIKGINGELYPCKADIFEKTYEKVTEELDE